MKTYIPTLVFIMLSMGIYAQAPESINYQAVARDATGSILSNQIVSFRISILQGSISGTIVYQETHTKTTNEFGLVTLAIGSGTLLSGNFSTINWGASSFWIKTELDPAGGSNYQLMGTSQFLSVPYALYAKTSGSSGGSSSVSDTDLDTKIQTEKAPDEDIIRFDIGGTERLVLLQNRLEPLGGNGNIFIGKDAGIFNTSGYNNTSTGYYSLSSNTTGYQNSAFGWNALTYNTGGNDNTAMGYYSLFKNGSGINNTAFGSQSLFNNTSGWQNTAIGFNTLSGNTSGRSNTAVGTESMVGNVIGICNTATGAGALNNCIGSNNTALGFAAGSQNQGSNNLFLGYLAGYFENGSNKLYIDNSETPTPLIWGDFGQNVVNINGNLGIGTTNPLNKLHIVSTADPLRLEGLVTSASNNYLVVGTDGTVYKRSGTDVSAWNLTGNSGTNPVIHFIGTNDQKPLNFRACNTPAGTIDPNKSNAAFGSQALSLNISGTGNSAFGGFSLYSNTTGINNVAFGLSALLNNSEGSFNTAFGTAALGSNNAGSYNTAVGISSLYKNTDGYYNTAVGLSSLENLTSGNSNTAVGKMALRNNLTGNQNVAFGTFAGYYETENDRLYIDNRTRANLQDGREKSMIYGVFDNNPANQKLTFNANVGIGTTLPTNKLHIVATADPLKLEGLQTSTSSDYLVVENDGVIRKHSGSGGSGWSLNGNSGTNPLTDYIGTSDSTSLLIKVNNSVSGWIDLIQENTSFGYMNLNSNIEGSQNTAVGNNALFTNQNGVQNTAAGMKALYSNLTGSSNTAIGYYSLFTNTYGSLNSAVGQNSLALNVTGSHNSSFGSYSLANNTFGQQNTALGEYALYANSIGNNNVALGYYAGYYETGSNRLYIDNQSRGSLQNGLDKSLIYGIFDANPANQQLTINGKVGIGASNPATSAALEIRSGNKGFLPPRMNTSEIAYIANPANGLTVYNTTDEHLYVYTSSTNQWKRVAYDASSITPFVCGTAFPDSRDGQLYQTVQIGTQCWMAQNLNVGNIINGATNQTDNGQIDKYCPYNDASHCSTFGGLYQWNEMMQYDYSPGSKGICPQGWHLPTNAEFTTLSDYLGGSSIAGGKMKEAGTVHWYAPNTGATNSSGFTGLPAGYRGLDGYFSSEYNNGFWWTSSWVSSTSDSYIRKLSYNTAGVITTEYDRSYGFSVRCIRD